MRAPVRSESDAFRLTAAGAATIAVSTVIGWLTVPLIGVAIFAIIFVIAALAYLRVGGTDRPAVLRAAACEPHPHGAPPRQAPRARDR